MDYQNKKQPKSRLGTHKGEVPRIHKNLPIQSPSYTALRRFRLGGPKAVHNFNWISKRPGSAMKIKAIHAANNELSSNQVKSVESRTDLNQVKTRNIENNLEKSSNVDIPVITVSCSEENVPLHSKKKCSSSNTVIVKPSLVKGNKNFAAELKCELDAARRQHKLIENQVYCLLIKINSERKLLDKLEESLKYFLGDEGEHQLPVKDDDKLVRSPATARNPSRCLSMFIDSDSEWLKNSRKSVCSSLVFQNVPLLPSAIPANNDDERVTVESDTQKLTFEPNRLTVSSSHNCHSEQSTVQNRSISSTIISQKASHFLSIPPSENSEQLAVESSGQFDSLSTVSQNPLQYRLSLAPAISNNNVDMAEEPVASISESKSTLASKQFLPAILEEDSSSLVRSELYNYGGNDNDAEHSFSSLNNDRTLFCATPDNSENMLTRLRTNITFLRTPREPPKGRLSTILTPRSMSYCVQEQFKKLFE